jgi:hypothetical protein
MTKILIDEAVVRQALEALEQIANAMPFPVGRLTITDLRQALEQPAQQEPNGFNEWWHNEGSQAPKPTDDMYEHCKRMCKIAWANGAYKALEQPAPAQPPWMATHPDQLPPTAPAQEPDPDELTIAYMSGVYEGKKIGAKEERVRFALECIDLVAFYGGPVDLEAAIREKGGAA